MNDTIIAELEYIYLNIQRIILSIDEDRVKRTRTLLPYLINISEKLEELLNVKE